MNYLKMNKIALLTIFATVLFTSCQRENMDGLVSTENDITTEPEFYDLTGTVSISTITTEEKNYFAYLTSCEEEDFFINSFIFAEDFNFENGLIKPVGLVNQIYWIDYAPLTAGVFKAYGSTAGVDGQFNESHYVLELDLTESAGSTTDPNIMYSGSFYPDPTYSALGQQEDQRIGSFNVSEVPCELDDIVPSILVLPNGDMVNWSKGRAEFKKDGEIQKYSSLMQFCENDESADYMLSAFIHFGHGLTDHTSGPFALAVSGEYLIYFTQDELPKSQDKIEAALIRVDSELVANYNSGFIVQNGYPIVLEIDLVETDRIIGHFTFQDSSGADFNVIEGTFNTRIAPCN